MDFSGVSRRPWGIIVSLPAPLREPELTFNFRLPAPFPSADSIRLWRPLGPPFWDMGPGSFEALAMLVAPSVYFYPFTSYYENNCNTVVIDGPEKVLIDPGHKHNWPRLKQQIIADRLEPSDIKLVLHTHCHPDHMEAGEILEVDYGAVQAMSSAEMEFLEGPGQKFFPWMGLDVPKGHIGRLLEEGELDLGDKALKLYLTPGHTPGSLCVHWPEAGILITGDLIFARSYGRTDFEGGDQEALTDSIERMSALGGVETLLPGHNSSIIGGKRVADNFQFVLGMLGR